MNLPFYRWHPQLALRYLPLVHFIRSLKLNQPKILEVGSGSLGIGPYLRQPFTGVDLDFSGPQWPDMKQIKAPADKLPFSPDEFDVSISVDVLEHLPPKVRARSVSELIRVAKTAVVIAAPCSQASQNLDQDLSALYQKKFGRPFPFLTEHLKYQLPQKTDITAWINEASKQHHKNISVVTQGNRNLILRRWLMHGWISKNILVEIFFRKILLLFLPILSLIDRRPPHYRQMFFVKINA